MRRISPTIQALIEPSVASLGYELVGIEYFPQGKHSLLRVYIDCEAGITLDDCTRVSHQISGLLDVEDVIKGHYNLEVSSPGLDRPLFTIDHFKQFVDNEINLKLFVPVDGRRRIIGRLCSASEESIVMDVDGKEIQFVYDNIDKANLVPEI